MTRAALALLLLVPLAAAQPAERDRGGWTEVLPAWTRGPATLAWNGTTVDVPMDAHYATDHETWLYVADGAAEPSGGLGCDPPHGAGTTGRWVLLDGSPCAWAPFPAVGCWQAPPCDEHATAEPVVVTREVRVTPASQLVDSCGRIQGARCTPAPAWGALAALGLAALLPATKKTR